MRNVIFYLFNTSSHYNATYMIAKRLKSFDYNPVYVGDIVMKDIVVGNGFDFYEYSAKLYCINKGKLTNQQKVSYDSKDIDNYREYYIKGGYFDFILNKFNPEAFFLDVSKIHFFPELLKKGVKLIILSTKVNLNKNPYIPPFNSLYIPYKRNVSTWIKCEMLWMKVLLIKWAKNIIVKSKNDGFSLYDLPFQYIEKNKFLSNEIIYKKRVNHFGLKGVPELIMSPAEFEFNSIKTEKNQVYIGPSVYTDRIEEINAETEVFLQKENLIYCSMGIYDFNYRTLRIRFINKLLQIAREKKDYNFLISIGNDLKIQNDFSLTKNVLISKRLPQIRILKYARIMITHGGMQSITECILNGVPLLVYPLNPNLDQKGNAARVVFHGVGLSGNIISDSSEMIITKINELMTNKLYLDNVRSLRNRYLESDNFEKGISFIIRHIDQPISYSYP